MKRKVMIAAIAATTIWSGTAFAQGIPVHDSSSLIQQIEQVRQAAEVIRQGQEQIRQAQELYEDISGLTDIPQVAQQLGDDALRGLDVGSGSLRGFGTGDYDFIGSARERVDSAYQDMLDSLGEGANDADRDSARMVASRVGTAETVGSSVQQRRQYIQELSDRLATAETSKEVQDLQARISAESLHLQNDMMALQAIELERQAAAAVRAEQASNRRLAGLRARREANDRALGE